MKILIAPNSFKEVADCDRAAELFKKYLSINSSLTLATLPISDGGDGFLCSCRSAFNLEILKYEITTAYDESKFDCEVGYDRAGKRIYIESARVLGLKVIPREKRSILQLSSKGIGDLFIKLIDDIKQNRLSVEEVIIGIGGTGTNDLGLGVCSRFGIKFYDLFGQEDEIIPEFYYRLRDIGWESPKLPFRVEVIVDVDNPLLGPKGAARIFGPQKGADKGEVEVMELGFKKIVNILKDKGLERSFDKMSGAGGGLAAGLHLFFNAYEIKANEFIRKQLNLEEEIQKIDVVVTGEGKFDEQTFSGKGAGVVLNLALEHGKKVFLCCGLADEKARVKLGDKVHIIQLISFFRDKEESIKNFEKGIEFASREIISML